MVNRRIVQIMPASAGWRAIYEVQGEAVARPLACWCLISEGYSATESSTYVTAMDMYGDQTGVVTCDEHPDFLGYLGPSEKISAYYAPAARRQWMRELKDQFARRQEQPA
jgi:hypothetical protein